MAYGCVHKNLDLLPLDWEVTQKSLKSHALMLLPNE